MIRIAPCRNRLYMARLLHCVRQVAFATEVEQDTNQVKGGSSMNSDILKGNWKELKGNVKQQWGKLTDDDLDQIDGRREELIGRVQQRYGHTRQAAEREV